MIDLLAIAFLLAEYPSQLGKTRLVPFSESTGSSIPSSLSVIRLLRGRFDASTQSLAVVFWL
jgi:hypothetical protein